MAIQGEDGDDPLYPEPTPQAIVEAMRRKAAFASMLQLLEQVMHLPFSQCACPCVLPAQACSSVSLTVCRAGLVALQGAKDVATLQLVAAPMSEEELHQVRMGSAFTLLRTTTSSWFNC